MPLLGWAIWKARRWIPEAVIHVATEHPEIASYAMDQGCTLFPLTAADIADQRDAAGPLTDFLAATVARPVISLDCSFPFLLRSELNAALSDPRDFVRPVLRRTLHLESYGNTLSQDIPEQAALQSNYLVARRREPVRSEEWLDPKHTLPVSWLSSINIDTPQDLQHARWIAQFIRPEHLDDTL